MSEQPKKVVPKVVEPEETPEEFPEEEEEEEIEEEIPKETPKVQIPQKVMPQREVISEEPKDETKQLQETIMSLHDNGLFRLELLNNLSQINRNLTIVAGVLLEISGHDTAKK